MNTMPSYIAVGSWWCAGDINVTSGSCKHGGTSSIKYGNAKHDDNGDYFTMHDHSLFKLKSN